MLALPVFSLSEYLSRDDDANVVAEEEAVAEAAESEDGGRSVPQASHIRKVAGLSRVHISQDQPGGCRLTSAVFCGDPAEVFVAGEYLTVDSDCIFVGSGSYSVSESESTMIAIP